MTPVWLPGGSVPSRISGCALPTCLAGLITFDLNALLRLVLIAAGVLVVLHVGRHIRALVDELELSRRAVRHSRTETIKRLARAAQFRDDETGEHTKRMGEYCYALARSLGIPEERAELIRIASPLHDVGKIAVPDRIMLKPGPLTEGEIAIMREHTQIGFDLLAGSGQEALELAASIALTHHERFDGSGYPRGLVGEQIPIEGRIAAVADVFDALTSDRPYRAATPTRYALSVILAGSGSQFDPAIVDAFILALDDVLEVRERYARTAPLPAFRGRPATPLPEQDGTITEVALAAARLERLG